MSKVTMENKFLDLVRRSGLIEEAQLEDFLDKTVDQDGKAALDNRDLAKQMVDHHLLTQWQADKLLNGKHKGFHLGKYKLLRQIGKGGMSSVYLAEHMLMKRPVAVKVLPRNRVQDPAYVERFRLEARAVAKLDDPNIVRAYDIDNEGNIHYIVMEYVNGDDLHQIVSKNGGLDFVAAADYIAQAALGMQHAHEQGLVHRDIKPANFIVDQSQTVKMLDLGLAKLVEDDITSLTLANDENVLGTADYLAPEQALNSHGADARADIYSLGCTFYFVLTGRPPFSEGTISERLLKHQSEQPESLFTLRSDLPPSLGQICERMMAKKPEDRYQTAGELAMVLSDWLAERGRTLGGRKLNEASEPSGVGSGVFQRFSLPAPTPVPISSPSSETVAVAGRDTENLVDLGSGSALDEDFRLAPDKNDEDVISGIGTVNHTAATTQETVESDDLEGQTGSTSLVEEELHDPEAEAIARMVARRAKFNPLQPPSYTPPSQSSHTGLWLALGGILLLIGFFVVVVLTR
jgi:serine/threonine-protein kinase